MKLKYYLRGLGIGIAVTAIILTIANAGGQKPLTDEEIIERAEELGMIRPEGQDDNAGSDGRTIDALSGNQKGQEEGISKEENGDSQNPQEEQKSSDGQKAKEGEDSSEKQDGEDSESSKDQKEENQASSQGQEKENQPSADDQESSGGQSQASQGNQTSSDDQQIGEGDKSNDSQSDENKGGTDTSSSQEGQTSQAGQNSQGGSDQPQETEYITIEITQGDFSDRVSQKLKEAGLVEDASDFNNYLVSNGIDGRLTVGSHQIPKGAKYDEIAKILCEKGGSSQ